MSTTIMSLVKFAVYCVLGAIIGLLVVIEMLTLFGMYIGTYLALSRAG